MNRDTREKHATQEVTSKATTNLGLLRVVGLLTALSGVLALGLPTVAKGQVSGAGGLLEIRVDNYSRATPATLAQAEREASQILQKAGLRTQWVNCDMEGVVGEECGGFKENTSVELRIVVQTEPEHSWTGEFGYAVLPSFARVYYARATRVAKLDNADYEAAILLGCVMAHEIGHLLLGPNSHSPSGIMQARWERQQILLALRGRLLFTEEEVLHIQREVAIRTSQQDSHFERWTNSTSD